MDLLKRIDLMVDTTVVSDVATNTAKGHVDVIGGVQKVRRGVDSIGYQCPKGQVWDKKTRTCIPSRNESSIVGGSYVDNTTVNIIGSGQTRVGGTTKRQITNLGIKEPIEIEMDDKTEENIFGRRGLKFSDFLGAYVPKSTKEIDNTQIGD